MADLIQETEAYAVVVSEPVEGVAHEKHYAVFNKVYGVVEFRTPVFSNAIQYMWDAQEALASIEEQDITSEVSDGEELH